MKPGFIGAVMMTLIGYCSCVQETLGQSRDSVYYFIDSDSKRENQTAGTYIHTAIRKSLMKNSDSLLLSYKAIISKKYSVGPEVTANSVFRWDNTFEGLKKSYLVKEEKMKNQGYITVLIE